MRTTAQQIISFNIPSSTKPDYPHLRPDSTTYLSIANARILPRIQRRICCVKYESSTKGPWALHMPLTPKIWPFPCALHRMGVWQECERAQTMIRLFQLAKTRRLPSPSFSTPTSLHLMCIGVFAPSIKNSHGVMSYFRFPIARATAASSLEASVQSSRVVVPPPPVRPTAQLPKKVHLLLDHRLDDPPPADVLQRAQHLREERPGRCVRMPARRDEPRQFEWELLRQSRPIAQGHAVRVSDGRPRGGQVGVCDQQQGSGKRFVEDGAEAEGVGRLEIRPPLEDLGRHVHERPGLACRKETRGE